MTIMQQTLGLSKFIKCQLENQTHDYLVDQFIILSQALTAIGGRYGHFRLKMTDHMSKVLKIEFNVPEELKAWLIAFVGELTCFILEKEVAYVPEALGNLHSTAWKK
jgi:hypothetical protein